MVRKKKRRNSQGSSAKAVPAVSIEDEAAVQKRRCQQEWFIILLLVAFGSFQSILYYGHLQVPNSDFPAFVGAAQPLFHFDLPGHYKRVPMLGILQIAVSWFCPGPHPILTGGWVLNGILHAMSVLLFYRIGKHLLGRSAFYFALLAGLNPWMLKMTTDPIAETTMIFMMLITFDFMLRRSKWCYLFAMMASLTRYELAALIAVAFFVDMVLCKSRKEKIASFVFAGLASVPMMLWIVLWRINGADTQHYTGHFLKTETRAGLRYWKLLWQTTFEPLLQLPSRVGAVFGKLVVKTQQQFEDIQRASQNLQIVIRLITGAAMVLAVIFGAIKKNWKFWALFAFWAIYVSVHTVKHRTLDRYTIPAIWLTLLFAFYGLQSLWLFIHKKWTPPVIGTSILKSVLLVICLVWVVQLLRILPATVSFSEKSAPLIYGSLATVMLYLVSELWVLRSKTFIIHAAVSAVFWGLLVTSNQFQVVRIIGNGLNDQEFKQLAEWYRENAEPEDKLVTTMKPVVDIFVPSRKHLIVHAASVKADTILEFAQGCKKRQLRYIAWDSRIGLSTGDYYYNLWGMNKMLPLRSGKDVGPFKYITTFKATQRRYVHLYRLEYNEVPTQLPSSSVME